jgi:hypothetical protein
VPGRKELNAQHPFGKLQVAHIWNTHPAGACRRVVLSMVAPYFPSSVPLYEYGQKLNTSQRSHFSQAAGYVYMDAKYTRCFFTCLQLSMLLLNKTHRTQEPLHHAIQISKSKIVCCVVQQFWNNGGI